LAARISEVDALLAAMTNSMLQLMAKKNHLERHMAIDVAAERHTSLTKSELHTPRSGIKGQECSRLLTGNTQHSPFHCRRSPCGYASPLHITNPCLEEGEVSLNGVDLPIASLSTATVGTEGQFLFGYRVL